jgi:hypothetical protein
VDVEPAPPDVAADVELAPAGAAADVELALDPQADMASTVPAIVAIARPVRYLPVPTRAFDDRNTCLCSVGGISRWRAA